MLIESKTQEENEQTVCKLYPYLAMVFLLWWLVCTIFRATPDALIDTAFAALLHQHHINRSFISHQESSASPRQKKLNKQATFCLHICLFSLSKHFLQALHRASQSQSFHFSVCDLPAEEQNYLKRNPNGCCSQTACRGSCTLASGDTECVYVCVWKPCLKNEVGQAQHTWLWIAAQALMFVQQRNLKSCVKSSSVCVDSPKNLCANRRPACLSVKWTAEMDTAGSLQTATETTSLTSGYWLAEQVQFNTTGPLCQEYKRSTLAVCLQCSQKTPIVIVESVNNQAFPIMPWVTKIWLHAAQTGSMLPSHALLSAPSSFLLLVLRTTSSITYSASKKRSKQHIAWKIIRTNVEDRNQFSLSTCHIQMLCRDPVWGHLLYLKSTRVHFQCLHRMCKVFLPEHLFNVVNLPGKV